MRRLKIKLGNLFYESAGKYALLIGYTKRFMNLGYKSAALNLKPGDINEGLQFQLYNVVTQNVDLKDKQVLEIGCGRGGGCYFLKEYKHAGNVMGIDLSESNIKLAKKLVNIEHVSFLQQSAEKIDIPPDSFDAVVNIESSHCYTNKKIFVNNVLNVLKTKGCFIYADIFLSENLPKIKEGLVNTGFTIEGEKDITEGVLMSLKERTHTQVSFLKKYIAPLFLRSFFGYENSHIYTELRNGKKIYYTFVCLK